MLISTVEELDALPVGAVVVEGDHTAPDQLGDTGIATIPGVFHKFPNGWHVVAGHGVREVSLPATVLAPRHLAHARTDIAALIAEVERLEHWKSEALEVIDGLQELGHALGLPLGERVTGETALERARELCSLHNDQDPIVSYPYPTMRALRGDGMSFPEEAVEAVAQSIYETSWYGDVPLRWGEMAEDSKIFYRQRAAACLAEALPTIEKEIRAQAAADIWEYWDACGDLIDDRDSARQAIDAIAAQIAEGADHA